jgi:hypothetical protein
MGWNSCPGGKELPGVSNSLKKNTFVDFDFLLFDIKIKLSKYVIIC